MTCIFVRGVGDVGSAVAYVLFAARHRVVIHDEPAPSHSRRGMSYTDALYRRKVEIDGVMAKYARTAVDLAQMVECQRAIPVVDLPFDQTLAVVAPDVLVDARMRKRVQPESQRGFAPLTVGVGPNFVAGDTADVVIETAWGPHLGDVIEGGSASPLSGEPRSIERYSRERFVYAPAAGIFATRLDIGATVVAGDEVGRVGDMVLRRPCPVRFADWHMMALTSRRVPRSLKWIRVTCWYRRVVSANVRRRSRTPSSAPSARGAVRQLRCPNDRNCRSSRLNTVWSLQTEQFFFLIFPSVHQKLRTF